MEGGIRNCIESIKSVGIRFQSWRLAFSGGKDSTAMVTLICWLIDQKEVQRSDNITLSIVDTRQEIPVLIENAQSVAEMCRSRFGFHVKWLQPDLKNTFLYHLLGRGLSPPRSNGTNRWCTRLLKVKPQEDSGNENDLVFTGSRVSESDARSGRFSNTCALAGSECGAGIYRGNVVSPLAYWRNCAVWDWLMLAKKRVGYDAKLLIHVYGEADKAKYTTDFDPEMLSEIIDSTSRTGCIGCPVVSQDSALSRICEWPEWEHLTPFKELKLLYEVLRGHVHRHKKPPGELNKNGTPVRNPGRVGPICLESRRWALAKIKDMQNRSWEMSDRNGRPRFVLISDELENLIVEAIDNGEFPRKWDGTEPIAASRGFGFWK